VNINSPDASIVFTFSFSKMMGMPRAFSFRLKFRLSAVLRATAKSLRGIYSLMNMSLGIILKKARIS